MSPGTKVTIRLLTAPYLEVAVHLDKQNYNSKYDPMVNYRYLGGFIWRFDAGYKLTNVLPRSDKTVEMALKGLANELSINIDIEAVLLEIQMSKA
jgi:hypothetical protein